MTASVDEALRRALAFNFPGLQLPARQARPVADACRLRRLTRGATLFAQGRTTPALFAVVTGELEGRFVAADGNVSVIEHITPFTLFGLASFASGAPSTYEAVARKASQVLCIEHAAYDQLMDEVPGFARALLKELATRHSNTLQLLELARHQPAPMRLASALSRVMPAASKADKQGWRFVKVTQSELAALSGLSRQTVNEVLATWSADGKVRTQYGGIWLPNS